MKITLINVMSLDGKLTKWDDDNVHEWTSPEDFAFFNLVKGQNNLLVMDGSTFEAVHPTPEKERLRIIVTQDPKRFSEFEVAGQIEFTKEKPRELVERLKKLGYKQILLVGGRRIATSFFQENLIDEVWLTVEPRIFGKGETLVNQEQIDISLRLFHMEKMNEQGTILLKYKVLKT